MNTCGAASAVAQQRPNLVSVLRVVSLCSPISYCHFRGVCILPGLSDNGRLQAHTVPVELQSFAADQAAVTELIPVPWPTVARNGMHGASAAGRNRGSGIVRGQLSVTDLSGSGMPGVVQGSLPCQ